MRWAAVPLIRAGVPLPGWLTGLRRNAAGVSPRCREVTARHTWSGRLVRIGANLLGAAFAALFARASIAFYLQSHRLIGAVFFLEQAWFAVLFLIRRPPRVVSDRLGAWLLATAGTFGGLLLRPQGAHRDWGVQAGLGLQLLGLALAVVSVAALGRSFGFVAADRGLVTRGPYAVVRHPVYAAYVMIQCGYVLQAISVRNIAVLALATGCNAGRAICQERVLAERSDYAAYRKRVRRRLLPGVCNGTYGRIETRTPSSRHLGGI
jgi:protein-S-isoprenylcysteine O-methyltransferase Ste14